MKDVNILINSGVNVQASLELLGDMEMYDETLSDFVDMVGEKIANLEKNKADNDMPNYAINVHALKSDARYLGFLALGDLCYDSELKAKAGDSAGVNTNHPVIMADLDKMINLAKQYLGRSDAAPATPAPAAQPAAPAAVQPAAAQPVATPTTPTQVAQPAQPVQPVAPAAQPVAPATPAPVAPATPAPAAQPVQPVAPAQPMAQPMPAAPTEQIYDLASGQMISQPAANPAPAYPQPQYAQPVPGQFPAGQPMDPMSQALYAQEAQSHQMPTNLAPKEGTILVVDDSSLVANFVKKIFNARYDVVIASDGAKAIELCASDEFRAKIKACLLDLNMPNVDGYQVLEDFYNKGYFVRMPIAVISGVEDAESIDKVNKYPIIDILAKPFNERDVQRVVEKCLAAYF